MIARDLNEDGKIDLGLADYGSNQIGILLGNGDGTFAAPSSIAASGNPISVTAGDFNGDGHLDLVTASYSGNNFYVFLASTLKPLDGGSVWERIEERVWAWEPVEHVGLRLLEFHGDGGGRVDGGGGEPREPGEQ